MKKTEFMSKFAEVIGKTKKETEEIVSALFAFITKTIKSGDEVALPEFGKWLVQKKPARVARNPMTGQDVKVPAKTVVKFRPSKQLKETILGVAKKPVKK